LETVLSVRIESCGGLSWQLVSVTQAKKAADLKKLFLIYIRVGIRVNASTNEHEHDHELRFYGLQP
jgi:hypothetical protein